MKLKIVIALLTMYFIATFNVPHHTEEIHHDPQEPFTQEQILMYQSEVIFSKNETMIIEHKHEEPSWIVTDVIPLSEDLQIFCQEKCKEYGVAYSFFLAMVESESSFQDVIGDSGLSYGRMQIRKCNWDRYDGLDAHNELDNLEIGIRMLGELVQKYQEADKVIMAYKGGETAMLGWVEEGFRLPICDELETRAMYWAEVLANENV